MHESVLLQEVIDGLEVKPGAVIIDGTLGDGGHAEALCRAVGSTGLIVGIDEDEDALARAKEKLEKGSCTWKTVLGNFRNLSEILAELSVDTVDGIILDLGIRSGQLDESGRGFSLRKDEPLLMTFKKKPEEGDLTAYEIANRWSKDDLMSIIREYGEERFARRIAEKIVEKRKEHPIGTTNELTQCIAEVVPEQYKHKRLHFATKTFQALRIAANDEIQALEDALKQIPHHLAPNGRIAIISFHSIEDRVVKRDFKEKEKEGLYTRITKKPITPREEEKNKNPRSRSAKLRIAEKNAKHT